MGFNLTFEWRRGRLSSVFCRHEDRTTRFAVHPLTEHPAWCQVWESTGQHRLRTTPPPLAALALQGHRGVTWNGIAYIVSIAQLAWLGG